MAMQKIVPAVLNSLLIMCVLTSTAEAQFAWQPGFEWQFGQGLNDSVRALTVLDDGAGPVLYAAGNFTIAGDVEANCVAGWDGATWRSLGSQIQAPCSIAALTVLDLGTGPALYAGGLFALDGGERTDQIAKWDGVAWVSVGTANHRIHALTAFYDGLGQTLIAGGQFSTIDGVLVRKIAQWDGTDWTSLNEGVTLGIAVDAMTVFDDGTGPALFVCGAFERVDNMAIVNLAKWDGVAWSAMGNAIAAVVALTVFDDGTGPALYAGGGSSSLMGRVARWNGGTSWTRLGSFFSHVPFIGGQVQALIGFDDGTGPGLYAAGFFNTYDPIGARVPINYIAKWDGETWTPLDTGMDAPVRALAEFDDGTGPALFAGGIFGTAGEVPSTRIAKWGAQ